MLTIWKNFVTKRNPGVFVLVMLFMLMQIMMAFTFNPWWIFGPLSIAIWLFVVPSAIYLIERDSKNNPERPKTLKNLGKILTGK